MRDPVESVKKEKDIASIYTLYVDDLFTYGCYLGFESEIVKDAIHDVFIKVTTGSDKLDNISNIKFYLFKSLKNRLLDIHKNLKEHIGLEDIDPTLQIPFNIPVNVEELMIEKEEQVQIKTGIEQMLSSLTDRQREIIYLRYVQEYDYDQIAELLHISVHGCRKLVSKAILSLREKYGIFFLLGYHSYFLLTLR
ncbi:sigma-70 family RNA polymerase sigma factor [uncultured Proteiniphilum sp.]|uniref:RNA polymerase sigma factor n=1 Tax=uncultured Proteiniphilum sp. TaxID=497637 RepID=UPI00262A4D4D|nr:sigma-70 family RNA polymerase sigma factor [uncultured Proteiniphilum sp.]